MWSEFGGRGGGGEAGTRRAVIPGSVLTGRSGGRWTVHWGRCFLPGGARSCLGGDRPEPRGARRGGGGAGYPGGVPRLAVAAALGEQRGERSARAGVAGLGGGAGRSFCKLTRPGGVLEAGRWGLA